MKEKERSSDKIERNLANAIMAGEYPIGSSLPAERELAKKFGVGRPTVREALQRLRGDGWITGRQGQSAIVCDYWRDGNVTTLVNIVKHHDTVTDDIIIHLLELRKALTPVYIRDAIEQNRPKVIALLANLEELQDGADCYASFDWDLQKSLAGLAKNPIYLLILNSFNSFYLNLAKRYFSVVQNRKLSLQYYRRLLKAALNGDSFEAERIVQETMQESLVLWRARENH